MQLQQKQNDLNHDSQLNYGRRLQPYAKSKQKFLFLSRRFVLFISFCRKHSTSTSHDTHYSSIFMNV